MDEIADMTALRARIDALDARLVAMLGERTRLIDRAAQIKARDGLPALIEARVEEVVDNARALAREEGVDPDLVESLWRMMVAHFIIQEDRYLAEHGEQKA